MYLRRRIESIIIHKQYHLLFKTKIERIFYKVVCGLLDIRRSCMHYCGNHAVLHNSQCEDYSLLCRTSYDDYTALYVETIIRHYTEQAIMTIRHYAEIVEVTIRHYAEQAMVTIRHYAESAVWLCCTLSKTGKTGYAISCDTSRLVCTSLRKNRQFKTIKEISRTTLNKTTGNRNYAQNIMKRKLTMVKYASYDKETSQVSCVQFETLVKGVGLK